MKNKWVNFLLIAGVTIAAPRLAGAFGQLIGVDVLDVWPWFASLEVFTGFALAILEGLALAHISDQWKRFPLHSPYWWILAVIQMVLLLALPFVSTVYLVAAQYGLLAHEVLTWQHIFNNHLTWLWSYLGAGISTIIVMGIGIVHNIKNEGEQKADTEQTRDPRFLVLEAVSTHGALDPGSIAEITKLPIQVAAREMDGLYQSFNGDVVKVKRNGKS